AGALPAGAEMHLGVYGIKERDHTEIQKRRRDFIALVMYLTERKLFFSMNHVFSGLTGRREEEDFSWFGSYTSAFEIRNVAMWSEANASAARLAKKWGKVGLGGSDAHTLAGVGLTYTEVRGARTVDEFIAGLRAGRATVNGVHGSFAKVTADVYRIAGGFFQEKPWAIGIVPLTVAGPALSFGPWVEGIRFCKRWTTALESGEKRPRMLWKLEPGLGVELAR